MEILEEGFDNTEPQQCDGCSDELNGINWIKLKLFKDFSIELILCGSCSKKLKKYLN